MEILHLEVDNPEWREVLGRLRHDFYHLPEYVSLDGEWNHGRPMAFLARSGDAELFIPYLLRRCDDLFPEAGITDPVYDVVSPYGYPGLLLSAVARRSPVFARQAMQHLTETLRDMGVCSAFFRMHPLLGDGLSDLFPEGFLTPGGETVAMDLCLNERQLWRGIRGGHQSTINRCRRLGFVPRMVALSEYLDCVVEIYRDTMDRVRRRTPTISGGTTSRDWERCPPTCIAAWWNRPAGRRPLAFSSNAAASSRPTSAAPSRSS